MGQIYLDFGEPVVLDQAPSGDDRLALAKIAFQVGVEANRVTPITPAYWWPSFCWAPHHGR